MGWGCGANASKVLDAWNAGCKAQTGSSNVFLNDNNVRCFFEINRAKWHSDGAVTGSIYRDNPDGQTCCKVATFRIESNGEITRAPAALKRFAEKALKEMKEDRDARRPYYFQVYGTSGHVC